MSTTIPARRAARSLLALLVFLLVVQPLVLSAGQRRAKAAGASSPLWLSSQEIAELPASGPAWTRLKTIADAGLGRADIADQESQHDTNTLAAALVYARTGNPTHREKVSDAIAAVIGTEAGGRTLAVGRNLPSYPIAADLIQLSAYDPTLDARFRAWLSKLRTQDLDGKTLVSTHERRPNNWGTLAGAARVSVSAYLGDRADVERAAKVFKGWLGDRATYAGFSYGALDWQADPAKPVGVNPRGASKVIDGARRNVDGVLLDDQRRQGDEGRGTPGKYATWPPAKENYVWEALQGAVLTAELLTRQGYPDAWEWQDRALLRAVTWLENEASFPAEGDDTWQMWLVNFAYGTAFATPEAMKAGKNMGWTDWTHARTRVNVPAPAPAPEAEPSPVPFPAPTAPPLSASVSPVSESGQVRGSGDVADDPAIWVHPTDSSKSLVLGTSKDSRGGLHVFELGGKERQFLKVGALNNVDLRYGFKLGSRTVDLVSASNRSTNSMEFFAIDPSSGNVTRLSSVKSTTPSMYGLCMANSQITGKYYAIPNFKSGVVEQYELSGTTGKITAKKVRSFDAGTQTEGCAADDALGHLYVGVEDEGVFKYNLDPLAGTVRTQVDFTGKSGNLVADTEGIAIYQESDGRGYLLVSSQGNSEYNVYAREGNNAFLGSFNTVDGSGVDKATGTDGLDVSSARLGPQFEGGLVVLHDSDNRGGSTSNYKFVRWDHVAAALNLRSR